MPFCCATASQVDGPAAPTDFNPQQPTQRRETDESASLQALASMRIHAFSSPFSVPLKIAEKRKHFSAGRKKKIQKNPTTTHGINPVSESQHHIYIQEGSGVDNCPLHFCRNQN